MIPVAIIHNNATFIYALPAIIETEGSFCITGIYYTMEDAIKGLAETSPDMVVLDICNPNTEAMEIMRTVKNKNPFIKILVYTNSADDETITGVLHAGVNGYVLNDEQPIQLINALHELSKGGAPVSPCIIIRLLAYFRQLQKKESNHSILSEREKEILHFTSRGLLYKEIGYKLGIQRETVKKHLARIYDKLQVQNKMEALNKFYRL